MHPHPRALNCPSSPRNNPRPCGQGVADESVQDARCSLELGFFDLLDDDVLEVAVNGEALEWASAERLSGGESHAPLGFAELSIR